MSVCTQRYMLRVGSSASAGLDNGDSAISAANIWTWSPKTVNETRAQFTYSDLKALPTDPIGPAVSISGVASFGMLSGSPQGRLNKMFEAVDNVSHQAGAHALGFTGLAPVGVVPVVSD